MNRNSHKENMYLNSDIYPRTPPHGQRHTITKIQPEVPEVSVFPTSEISRQPLGNVNRTPIRHEDTLHTSRQQMKHPLPQNAPTKEQFRQSDFSQILANDKSASMIAPVVIKKRENSPHHPTDLIEAMSKGNYFEKKLFQLLQKQQKEIETIKKIQEGDRSQIRRLENEIQNNQSRICQLLKENEEIRHEQQRKTNNGNFNQEYISTPKRVDAATQVSAPASPEKLNTSSRRVNNTPESRSVLRQEEENSVGRSHNMLYTSNTSLPLGISARKLEKTEFVPIDEDHHDLDDDENEDVEPVNLQELLGGPLENPPLDENEDVEPQELQDLIGFNPAHPDLTQNQDEEEDQRLNQLRKLGVTKSVIGYIDPVPTTSNPEYDPSMFYPRAHELASPHKTPSTTEYSLMIQTRAMKYLPDQHLTYIARGNYPKYPTTEQISENCEPNANMTRYGLPEANVSATTKNYLDQNIINKKF